MRSVRLGYRSAGPAPAGSGAHRRWSPSREIALAQEGRRGGDLILLAGHFGLRQRDRAAMLHQRDQVGCIAMGTGAAHGLAIERLALKYFALERDDAATLVAGVDKPVVEAVNRRTSSCSVKLPHSAQNCYFARGCAARMARAALNSCGMQLGPVGNRAGILVATGQAADEQHQ